MKYVRAYLKKQRTPIFSVTAAVVILSLTLALYGVSARILVYPVCLCIVLGLAALAVGAVRGLPRDRALARAEDLEPRVLESMLPTPAAMEEAHYDAIIHRLCGELRKLEEASDRRLAEQSDYYTTWAHQIKTPISALRLRLQDLDSAQARAMKDEVQRIEQYVEMVLVYQRLDSEQTDYLLRSCDLDGMIRQVAKRMAGSFILRGIGFRYTPVTLQFVTDEKWFCFVLEQLLSNALKYTPAGQISITLDENRILCIRDTGLGIAPEDLPRVFQRGFTGVNGRKDHRASGIGLYLCKRILDALGHGIRMESTLGEGTSVYLDLNQRTERAE